jgi:parallel beta-helix repeat protein
METLAPSGRASRFPTLAASLLALALLSAPPARAAAADRDRGRAFQVVSPGESIQAAIDRARPGGTVMIRPGVYRETADATNGLNITRSVHLVGLSSHGKKVILENSGGQKNAIVAVPADHTNCMGCHSSLAPPFPRLPGVKSDPPSTAYAITDLTISGITMKDFTNNGLFARSIDGFSFVDVHSVGNKNYGIFPVSSRNGIITRSSATGADDSGIWVETSENVKVTHNLVEGNVNGFEISNSQDILIANNEVRGNTVGIAAFFLPDIFGVRPYARRYTIRDNHVHDNNKPNTATPDAILSVVPPGTGILHIGVDDSEITGNLVENNDFIGIAVVDYCAVVQGGPFDCTLDPTVTPGFAALSEATGNTIEDNVLHANGLHPDPASPFAFAASDLGLLTAGDHGNCYAGNVYSTFFSLIGFLPVCR